MGARGVHRVENAECPRSADARNAAVDTRLCPEDIEGGVYVFWRVRAGVWPSGFAEAAAIEREHMDPGRGQSASHRLPRPAVAVALMQQQHAGTRLRGREVC